MPLPTSATVPRALPDGSHVSFTKRGSSVEPRLTPSRPPSFSAVDGVAVEHLDVEALEVGELLGAGGEARSASACRPAG